jgi:hypothetical protein
VLFALHHGYMLEWAPWSKPFTDEVQQRFWNTWAMLAGEVKQHASLWAYMIMCEDAGPSAIKAKSAEWAEKYYSFANGVAKAIRQADPNRLVVTSPNGLLYPRGFEQVFHLVQLLKRADSQVHRLDCHHYPNGWWVGGGWPTDRRERAPHAWQNVNPISEPVFCNLGTVFRSHSTTALGYPRLANEVGVAVPVGSEALGDDERLLMFERVMTVLYDMGVAAMVPYSGAWGFTDWETYFPRLLEFRDKLVTAPRPDTYDASVVTDQSLPQVYDPGLAGQINPAFRVLEEAGYS